MSSSAFIERHSSTFNQNAVMLNYKLEHQNPYSVKVSVTVPLHNLLTKLAVHIKVSIRLLKCIIHVNGIRKQEVIVEKANEISSTIAKRKFTDHLKQSLMTSTAILKKQKAPSSKAMADAQRSMDIATERGMSLNQILSHDLMSSSLLFMVTSRHMLCSQN